MVKHEILVPVNGHNEAGMLSTNVVSFVSWHRLLPAIKNAVTVNGNEEIVGLEVSAEGITVLIKYKT